MARFKIKYPLIIVLLLIILVVGAWLVISKTTSNKVEQAFEQWLVANDLQESFTWESLEASSNDTIKLKQVNIYDEGQALLLTAEEFNINHYKESDELIEVDLNFKQLVDVKAKVFQPQLMSYFVEANLNAPDAINVFWKMSLNKKAQRAFFNPVIELPEFMRLGLQLDTDSPEVYQIFATLLNDFDGFKQYGVFNLIPHTGGIKLTQLILDIDDLGGMKQLENSLKASAIRGDPSPEIDQQREAIWAQHLADSKIECFHDHSFARVMDNHQKACEILFDFMDGKRQTIRLKIIATKDITLEEAMLAGMMGLTVEMLLTKYKAQVVIE